jgi:hypothetical protein
MYGILISAFNSILGFALRTIVIKFVVFSTLFLIVSSFINYIVKANVLPMLSNAQSAAGSIPSSVAYMFTIFNVWVGISMIISAYTTRFMIRRIPFIG